MASFLGHALNQPTWAPETAWYLHGPFGMWLVHALRPRCIVELGTHSGYSYFAFCEAVRNAGIDTECFAVDTWKGDEHAGHYGEGIYKSVVAENKKYARFSTLLRETFDEARDRFQDGSIDLLHIDGLHTYEAVKHDFEFWRPKLSERAVVLFHDTVVRTGGFGVFRFWGEVSRAYPSFNFRFGNGLGVLLVGTETAEDVKQLFAQSGANGGPSVVEEVFAAFGEWMGERRALLATAEDSRLKLEVELRDREIEALRSKLVDARLRPVKQLKWKIVRRVLKSAAKVVEPLSERTAQRYMRSAAKRDPRRVESFSTSEPAQSEYVETLAAWTRQRKKMEPATRKMIAELADGPLISVVVPVYDTDPELLEEMIASVEGQTYRNWELCIADDASPNGAVRDVLRAAAAHNERIRVVYRDENGHISAATNSALDIARGSYVAFVDHDDLLDPDALLYVADCLRRYPDAKIIYTDEDKIRPDGTRFSPQFKPDWNAELALGMNFVGHLGVYAREMVDAVGGLREGLEGAQDHDLLLRCLHEVEDEQIHHIPRVLYSWRASPGSTAADASAKPYAWDAGVRAVSEYLEESAGEKLPVERGPIAGTYVPQFPLREEPSVDIVVPTRNRLDLLRLSVGSILQRTDYANYNIIIVDNGSTEVETLAWFEEIALNPRVSVKHDARPFNYSALNNAAIAGSTAEIVALVNNDIEVLTPGWLREMVSLAIRPAVGCVGAKLYYPDDRIQHAGVVLGIGKVAGHSHKLVSRQAAGYFGRLLIRQEYSAVTGACLVVRRAIYEEVGGLNETDLAVAFNDVDFCLKVREAGYRNIWTPYAEMYHFESASRKTEDTPEKLARFRREVNYMEGTWANVLFSDPAYNPNLSMNHEDFRPGIPKW